MDDLRVHFTEKIVGNGHPTLADTANRMITVAHNIDGTHKFATDSTKATSSTTGAIVTPGGVGIGGDVWVAGTTHSKITGDVTGNTTGTHTGLVNEPYGADIASAATPDIGASTGNYVKITGTTAITGFAAAEKGTRRIVEFADTLTLTHGATTIILPTSANITTAAGDVATFVSIDKTNSTWKCIEYTKIDGTALATTSAASAPGVKAAVNFNGMTYHGNYTRVGTTITVTLDYATDIAVDNIARLTFSGGATSGTYKIKTVISSTSFTVTDSVSGNITGTATLDLYLRSQYNVSSMYRSAPVSGDYTINFEKSLTDTNYMVLALGTESVTTGAYNWKIVATSASDSAPALKTVDQLRVAYGGNNTAKDVHTANIVIIGV